MTIKNSFFSLFSFFFNDTATTEIYTLSLHDALPIAIDDSRGRRFARGDHGFRKRGRPWSHRRGSNRHGNGALPERAGIGSRPNSPRAANGSHRTRSGTAEKEKCPRNDLGGVAASKCHCLWSEQDK